ncbi:HEAT repeat domain-containing protein [Fischerella sp.]|uniref:HEAT repeat domain-containing protein n=1 Tax=Fischerella sp. TaxID=1191 RepID=UPI0025BFEDF1|nr:HEAT repeat domain-containing protein [Fischerella sp.]
MTIEKEAKSALQQTDRKKAIAALVQLLQSDDVPVHICWQVEKSLVKIGTGNEMAIAALVQLLQSNHVDDYTRRQVASSLGKIDPGNEKAIAALVQLLQSNHVDDYTLERAASSLEKIIRDNNHRFALVKALRGYWRLNEDCYDVIWKCSQNMPYPDFYQAWHQHNFATRTMQSLKKILFTRII